VAALVQCVRFLLLAETLCFLIVEIPVKVEGAARLGDADSLGAAFIDDLDFLERRTVADFVEAAVPADAR
jgi:hypothetical protein